MLAARRFAVNLDLGQTVGSIFFNLLASIVLFVSGSVQMPVLFLSSA